MNSKLNFTGVKLAFTSGISLPSRGRSWFHRLHRWARRCFLKQFEFAFHVTTLSGLIAQNIKNRLKECG